MIGKEKGVIALLRSDPEIPEFFSYHCYFAPRTIVQQTERWRAQSGNEFRNQNRKFYYGTRTERHVCVQHSFSDWHNTPLEFTQPKATRKAKDSTNNDEWCGSISIKTEPVFATAWDRELHTLSRSTVPSVSIRSIFIHARPLLRLSDWIKRGVFVALCRHQDFGTRAGFHRESICLWRSSYIGLCHHHKIWSRKSFVWGPTDRPAAKQYSQRKTQRGEHCCLLVNLCSEEIARGIK